MPTPLALIAVSNGDYKGVAFDSNSDSDISSYGLGIGLSKKVLNGFDLGFNYSYSKFEEEGIFNPQTGQAFMQNILEKGGSEEPMELFKKFRGREPNVDALLRHSGIAA